MYKKCILIVVCLLAIPFVHAQKKNDAGSDSLYIYSSLFSKYLQAEDSEKAIFYGKKFKKTYEKRGLEKYTTYCGFVDKLAGLYYSLGNFRESLALQIELLPVKREIYGENSIDYASSLNLVSFLYAKIDEYKEAIRFGYEAL